VAPEQEAVPWLHRFPFEELPNWWRNHPDAFVVAHTKDLYSNLLGKMVATFSRKVQPSLNRWQVRSRVHRVLSSPQIRPTMLFKSPLPIRPLPRLMVLTKEAKDRREPRRLAIRRDSADKTAVCHRTSASFNQFRLPTWSGSGQTCGGHRTVRLRLLAAAPRLVRRAVPGKAIPRLRPS
jgi:hypothetical protein